jgi:hypothetical protein
MSINPDFELNDNVGRTTGQIHAAHHLMATTEDLRRWANRDCAAFRTMHGLDRPPAPSLDPAPYLHALEAAQTPAEVSAVTNALLDAVGPVIDSAVTYLSAAAEREKRISGTGKTHRRRCSGALPAAFRAGIGIAAEADEGLLRAEYDPAPAPHERQQPAPRASGLPPKPPSPGAGPTGPRP